MSFILPLLFENKIYKFTVKAESPRTEEKWKTSTRVQNKQTEGKHTGKTLSTFLLNRWFIVAWVAVLCMSGKFHKHAKKTTGGLCLILKCYMSFFLSHTWAAGFLLFSKPTLDDSFFFFFRKEKKWLPLNCQLYLIK